MMEFLVELQKEKRTGIVWILTAAGMVGVIYILLNFSLRKDSLLALPLSPMDVLLTQLYGVVLVFNLFGIILAACMIYQLEFKEKAIRKMSVLPLSLTKCYLSKFIILAGTLLLAIVLENTALGKIGVTDLPAGTFELGVLLKFAGYSFVTSLPVLAFMLLTAALFESIWLPLGVGVMGFLTGIAFATSKIGLFLLHPFVLMLRPATALTSEAEPGIVLLSLLETAAFLTAGVITAKKLRYE